MTNTTIEQTSFTPTTNPFEAAIQQAEQRERQRVNQEAKQAKTRRAQREREREEREHQTRVRNIKHWVESFFSAVVTTAIRKEWKPEAIIQAKAYAEALVLSASNTELPVIDPGMTQLIRGKFAYGLVLDQRGRQVIPERFFNGQRQDWFPTLFERTLREAR